MAASGLLTLDLGIRTGWLHAIGAGFDTGVEELGAKRGNTNGARFLKFEAFLEKRIEHGVELIAYEQALTHTPHQAVRQAAMAHGLVVVLEKVATKHGIEVVTVEVPTLKKHATGSGLAKKPTMIRILIDRFPQLQGRLVLVKPTSSWKQHNTRTVRRARKAVWVKCQVCCENYVCRKHKGKHVHDCNCPDVTVFEAKFGFSPYGQPAFKGKDPELVEDLERITFHGKIPDDNQVDAVWVAHWACENYAIGSNPFTALEAVSGNR